ncbi:MAG: acetyltransferase [Cyclobacteriaceae bacterium]
MIFYLFDDDLPKTNILTNPISLFIMYIYGASGHGRVIIDLLENGQGVQGIFDDDPGITEMLGHTVSGCIPETFIFDHPLVLAIGDNATRKKLYQKYMGRAQFATLIHPSAIISRRAHLEPGGVILERAIVKVNCRLGKQVIVNTGASIDHDCVIGDFAHIAPQATLCGGIQVGEGTLVGANSTVLPNLKIGAWCKIGAGSLVLSDVPDGATWIGRGLKGQQG